jgi:hypothetical protein
MLQGGAARWLLWELAVVSSMELEFEIGLTFDTHLQDRMYFFNIGKFPKKYIFFALKKVFFSGIFLYKKTHLSDERNFHTLGFFCFENSRKKNLNIFFALKKVFFSGIFKTQKNICQMNMQRKSKNPSLLTHICRI